MRKTIKQLLFAGLAFSMILTACTMEKRHYSSGYHIEWNSNKNTASVPSAEPKSNVTAVETKAQPSAVEMSNELATATPEVQAPAFENLSASNDNNFVAPATKTAAVKQFVTAVKENTTPQERKMIKQEIKAAKKANKAANASSGEKSQLIALILCVLLGGLGIHRFYLGYIGIGVIQLLTAGGCGVWALIDLIRIITGDLKPKDGNYDKTL